ncbi:MAG: DUF4179 domain-containing protein [Bacillota bacterium]|nr:DUF4179 domain-containing protein [Bacillota bacterium]
MTNIQYGKSIQKLILLVGIAAAVIFSNKYSITFAEGQFPPDSVFKYLYNENQVSGSYVEYAQKIKSKASDKGITFTIDEALYDGNILNISFIIQSNKAFDRTPAILGDSLLVNNKELAGSDGGSKSEALDSHTFIGLKSYLVNKNTLPQDLKVEYKARNIAGIDGSWSFKFNVTGANTMNKRKAYSPRACASIEGVNYKFNEVILTPVSSCLTISISFPDDRRNSDGGRLLKDFFLYDDKGNMLNPIGGRGSGENNDFSQELYFSNVKEVPDHLTVLPVDFLVQNGKPEQVVKEALKFDIPLNN